ncbi:MAG TPA: ABC transporter permease subunit [Stellaceae bacterium]|nr:ABC transporter permease subunit [Stellaceae bacterium]
MPLALGVGLAFLYGPIVLLVIYSFNESQLVTVWTGFSLKWYASLARNEQVLNAAKLSLGIAFTSATGAVILGTIAGFVLSRYKRFVGRTLFAGMISAPLVMPEVIMGLSMLLMFVGLEQVIGWPNGRGVETITIAHITFTMAFVAVIVQARLADMDASLEEAAMDLGARPAQVFFLITLPLIAPALVAGWLLAFSLSLDDLVMTAFVSGPGSSTLPLVIFSKVRLGLSPEINALATIIVAVVSTATLLAAIYTNRRATRI